MPQTPIIRILDASLNRASEGLRVVEDYVRFVLDDPFLTGQAKAIRHGLATASRIIPLLERHAARDTRADIGTSISTVSEGSRGDAWDVCSANLKRTQQSLRSLEEYGKLIQGEFAKQIESLRYQVYTLEKAIDVGRSSRDRLDSVRLCVLVDGCYSIAEFERLISELVGAGAGMIQLRDKRLDDRELVARARSLIALTRGKDLAEPEVIGRIGSRTIAVINDRAHIAAAVGADGVHLGQEDLSVKDARAVVGPRMLIGVSTHNIEQAQAAVLDGANYLGAGPTFASKTKKFDRFSGLEYLREVSSKIRLPTFAIGGITTENLPSVLDTGIERVAIGSSVGDAAEPAFAAKELLKILNESYMASKVIKPSTSLAPST